ncbi:hypothetical protein KKH56_07485 [bacterium]|nr:hypothetical protein [bacterium]
MDIGEKVRKVIQELVLPELEIIKAENKEIKNILGFTNKRLDDINIHLIDQSRRIDETNKRIDKLYEVIVRRDEHEKLERKIVRIEQDIAQMKEEIQSKMAA